MDHELTLQRVQPRWFSSCHIGPAAFRNRLCHWASAAKCRQDKQRSIWTNANPACSVAWWGSSFYWRTNCWLKTRRCDTRNSCGPLPYSKFRVVMRFERVWMEVGFSPVQATLVRISMSFISSRHPIGWAASGSISTCIRGCYSEFWKSASSHISFRWLSGVPVSSFLPRSLQCSSRVSSSPSVRTLKPCCGNRNLMPLLSGTESAGSLLLNHILPRGVM